MWAIFAFGSAVFAALTSILEKVGIDGVNSNLATAIRYPNCCCLDYGLGYGFYRWRAIRHFGN